MRTRPAALLLSALYLWSLGVDALSAQRDAAPLFRVTFLGTGAPRPSFQRYGPSTLIEVGDQRILLDPSWGLRERLMQAGSFELLVGLDHVLVTHLHYDHTIGLPDLWLTGWLYGRHTPLKVQGPPGTAAMLDHVQRAFEWDVNYRVAVGLPRAGSHIEATDVAPGVIFERDGVKITAFDVEHMPIDLATRQRIDHPGRTYGYRLDYAGRSVVFSGDTRPSDAVLQQAKGADVLVHEAQVPSPGESKEAQRANISLSVHATPEEAARIFAGARPRLAVYSHIIPPDVTADALLAATRPFYDGRVAVAHDMMMVTIGDRIEIGDRPKLAGESFEKARIIK